MYWQDESEDNNGFEVPKDVFDVLFRLSGKCIPIDHAQLLSDEIAKILPARLIKDIGIHQIRVAETGNGWQRPEQSDDLIELPRRIKLILRIHKNDYEDIIKLTGTTLVIGNHAIIVGASKIRLLSNTSTLFARAVICDEDQPEEGFLSDIAKDFFGMGIDVKKMICGKTQYIKKESGKLFARSLMVSDLSSENSVMLQQRGLGSEQIMGCGLFIPHKSISAVNSTQG
jgi:CRISPR-associated protein Cas6